MAKGAILLPFPFSLQPADYTVLNTLSCPGFYIKEIWILSIEQEERLLSILNNGVPITTYIKLFWAEAQNVLNSFKERV